MENYSIRKQYDEAFTSFIEDVNDNLEGINIYTAKKLTQSGVSNLSKGQKGSYLIITLQDLRSAGPREALAIYAPAFDDNPAPERTLRFKSNKRGLEGISLVRFKNGDEPYGHPYPELDTDMHLATSQLINQSSFQPLFEPCDKDEPGLPPVEHFTALAREGSTSRADVCFNAALSSDDNCAELITMLEGTKRDPSVIASEHMIRLASWTRGMDRAGDNANIENAMRNVEGLVGTNGRNRANGNWHALGLDALYNVLENVNDEILSAKDENRDPDYESMFANAFGTGAARDAQAIMGLCSLAIYRRCDAYMQYNQVVGSNARVIPEKIYDMLGSAAAMNEKEYKTGDLGRIYAGAIGGAESCYPKYILESKQNTRRYDDEDLYRQWRADMRGDGTTAYDPELFASDTGKRAYITYGINAGTGRAAYSFSRVIDKGGSHSESGGALRILMSEKTFAEEFPALARAKADGGEMTHIIKALGDNGKIDVLKAEFEAFKAIVTSEDKDSLRSELAGEDAYYDEYAEYDINDEAGGDDNKKRKGRSLIEEATDNLIGIPDESKHSLSFGWLAKKACKIDGKTLDETSIDNPLRLKAIRMNSFDPHDPAYEACAGYIDTLCRENAEAMAVQGEAGLTAIIRSGAKLNDFLVMMDVYRPDTKDGIDALKDDIEAMHAGKPADNFLYRPSCSSDVEILKSLAKDGVSLDAFRGLHNGDRDKFAETLADTIANDISGKIDTDKLLNKIRLDAVSTDTMMHRGPSTLIEPVRMASIRREENIEAAYRTKREFQAAVDSLEDSPDNNNGLSFTD